MNKNALLLLLVILFGVFGYKFIFQAKTEVGGLVPAKNAMTQLSDAFKNEKPIFLEFYSDNCPACRKAKPWIEDFYQTYGQQINFILADTEKGGLTLARHLGVNAVPTFVLYNSQGKMIDAFAGYPAINGKEFLENKIKGLVK